MRAHTITALFDGQEWLARPVDPAGWLAGTTEAAGDRHAEPAAGNAGVPVATTGTEGGGRLARGGRTARVGERVGRRSTRPRRRRVSTRSLSRAVPMVEESATPAAASVEVQ